MKHNNVYVCVVRGPTSAVGTVCVVGTSLRSPQGKRYKMFLEKKLRNVPKYAHSLKLFFKEHSPHNACMCVCVFLCMCVCVYACM